MASSIERLKLRGRKASHGGPRATAASGCPETCWCATAAARRPGGRALVARRSGLRTARPAPAGRCAGFAWRRCPTARTAPGNRVRCGLPRIESGLRRVRPDPAVPSRDGGPRACQPFPTRCPWNAVCTRSSPSPSGTPPTPSISPATDCSSVRSAPAGAGWRGRAPAPRGPPAPCATPRWAARSRPCPRFPAAFPASACAP